MTPEQRARAIAFNAVGPALRTVGLWAKLTSRQTIADRVLAALAEHGLVVVARADLDAYVNRDGTNLLREVDGLNALLAALGTEKPNA
ncbi:hypothetical protein OIE13_22570 [Streptosporangium sp. NBC_01810]|uniref:hypothetical protein n=1 Tax=Streptosporangium sp. NBC_01810 TaxID=2975951 RepID=UPI002DDBD744|nr:hypothetical protein [Streptosporangium sp. NBC_01810]WSA23729.1 hypothetical protein OIE13_22570 [Streptosporangium sp. NBC_01810]